MYFVPCCYGDISDCGEVGCLFICFGFVCVFVQFVFDFISYFLLVRLVCGLFFVRLRHFNDSLLVSFHSLCSCFNREENGLYSKRFKSRLRGHMNPSTSRQGISEMAARFEGICLNEVTPLESTFDP